MSEKLKEEFQFGPVPERTHHYSIKDGIKALADWLHSTIEEIEKILDIQGTIEMYRKEEPKDPLADTASHRYDKNPEKISFYDSRGVRTFPEVTILYTAFIAKDGYILFAKDVGVVHETGKIGAVNRGILM
ncbi:hypothetical protein HZA39_01855 [Candidatus Peregrinibacteria bacterium]|nr:hypothetical protein [Candidatus Peregrinibacteria bacterium]